MLRARVRMMARRFIAFAAFASCVFAASIRAADPPAPKLDPESKTPYTWRIVLHTRPHPLLGPTFRGQVRREVLAALQPALDKLGTVEFVDLAEIPKERWEPLWQQFADRGWAALDFSGTRELNGIKTHVLNIDFRDGTYHVEARQLDGFTGLASPEVRRRETRATEVVGRTAGLLLDRDFGACGTVEPGRQPDEVTVQFRGGALGSFERLVKEGDVFAVAGLRKSARPPGPPPARSATGRLIEKPKTDAPQTYTPVQRPFTLLKALDVPKDGAVKCKVLTGYPADQAMPVGNGIIGYRCLRLPAVTAPLAIRLGSGTSAQQSAAARVRANDIGWAVPPGGDDLEFRDGIFYSNKPLGPIAFVTLSAGATSSARVPIAVLGAGPVAIPFIVSAADEKRIRFERECQDFARRVIEARTSQSGCFDALSKLISARRNSDALVRAKAGHATTAADDEELTAVLERLRGQVSTSPLAADLLAFCDRQLADLRKTQTELTTRIKDLESITVRENDPARAGKQVQADALRIRIKVLIERGEVDEALTVYDQLVTLLPDSAEVKTRRDQLRTMWTPKSPAHTKARDFMSKTWPALTSIQDMKDNVSALSVAMNTCIAANDRLGLRKLLAVLADATVRLPELIAPLDAASESDRKLINDAQHVTDMLKKIDTEAREFLKKNPDS